MRRREISAFGKITNEGRLSMFMGEVNEFFKQWKGQKVVATFTVIGGSPSEALKGYYYHYIVPTMTAALWESGERMTEKDCEEWIRKQSPVTHRYDWINSRQWGDVIKEIDDLSSAEMTEHIEWLKQLAAEEYGVYIEEPRTILNEKFDN